MGKSSNNNCIKILETLNKTTLNCFKIITKPEKKTNILSKIMHQCDKNKYLISINFHGAYISYLMPHLNYYIDNA